MSNGRVSFYVTDGPLATRVSEVSEGYFQECREAGHGGTRVVLSDGTTEWIVGSRYLDPRTSIRAEVVEGHLQVLYLGEVLREYTHWIDYTNIGAPQGFPIR
jgi:hypothetical protein